MDTNHEGLPAPGTSKRRKIVRAALSAALTEQERRDAETPPASLLTTMGAVRLMGDLVLDRHGRGWTDPELVVLLRDLGVEISPETLRVYRGRLKKERGGNTAATPIAVRAPAGEKTLTPPPLSPSPSPPAVPSEAASNNVTLAPAAATGPTARFAHSRNDDDQPPFDRSIPFDDRV